MRLSRSGLPPIRTIFKKLFEVLKIDSEQETKFVFLLLKIDSLELTIE